MTVKYSGVQINEQNKLMWQKGALFNDAFEKFKANPTDENAIIFAHVYSEWDVERMKYLAMIK